jgi:D-amino peptidase
MRKVLLTGVLAMLIACLSFCGREQKTATEVPAYTVNAVRPDADGTTKILLYYDMEGISGVNRTEQTGFGNPEYQTGRDNLTQDVNAVIAGLFAGGADVVHVTDAHGSGNPEPDVDLGKLDQRAQMIYKDTPFDPYSDLPEAEKYDAVAVVCMHAKTGSSGFIAHTYNGGCDWIINGKSINETEIIAFSWGRFGVSVIFASGDDVLNGQLEYMDWLEYVTVKKAINWFDAELYPLDVVHAEMQEKAKKSVENLSRAKYVAFTEPLTAALRTQFPADHSILEGVPGIHYKDRTVTFPAKTYREAYDGIVKLIQVAGLGRLKLMQEYLAQSEQGPQLRKEFRSYMFRKYEDWMAGKWDPNAAPEKEEKKDVKYFGAK